MVVVVLEVDIKGMVVVDVVASLATNVVSTNVVMFVLRGKDSEFLFTV